MVEDRFYLDQLIFMVDWALSITDQSLFVFVNVHSTKCSYVLTIQKHLQFLQPTETPEKLKIFVAKSMCRNYIKGWVKK